MKTEYKKLELDKILDMLAAEAWSDCCKEKISHIEPVFEPSEVRILMKKTDDAFVLSSKFGTPRFYNMKDVCKSAKRASQGSKLTFRELMDTALVLREISGLCEWYSQCESVQTSLDGEFGQLVPNKYLYEKINTAIISEDEMSDAASPELSRIRKAIVRQGMLIKEQLDKIIKSQSTSKYLQETIVTQRDGRYVVPVKIEHRSMVSGLVHDTSASGSTVFVEPMSVVEANNEIRLLKNQEFIEIERIISELSAEVGEFAEIMEEGYKAAIELEMYFAKANLAAHMKASVPEICDEPVLFLNKARHPLIAKDKVVPITLSVGEEYSCLIVTGPNTGGKTVSIKTAGLLTLMAMCGLMLPTGENSKVGCFENVLVDIGDEQSIEQNLSTFSSHMTNIIRILEKAGNKSLVLLDELGSGTDPVEGAALAVAILSRLKDNGCRVVATTHYQEVKMFAIEQDGVENASCEFDVATLKPTYKFIVGIPGKSNAFSIVKRLGMSDDIIGEAKTLVDEENKRFEKIVEKLERTQNELEKSKERIRLEERKAKQLSEEMEKQREAIEKQKDYEIAQAHQKAMSIVEEVRFNADKLMEQLEQLKKEKDAADFSERVKSSRGSVNSRLNAMYDTANPVVEKKKSKYKLPRALKMNDSVLLMDIDKKGTLVSLPDASGNCFVQVGLIKTKTNIENLQLVEEEKVKFNGKTVSKQIQSNMTRKSSMEIDIRGMNADEGVMEVDRFIDSCLLGGLHIITIIHGKGTGVLRNAIHAFLKTNKCVKSYRLGVYGEGEAGVTVVELK